MSRIGKQPVPVPDTVTVQAENARVEIKGPKGTLKKQFSRAVKIEVEEGQVMVRSTEESRFSNAMSGTARSIVANMIQGVTEGFNKDLQIEGVGFRAALQGQTLDLSLGYSHPIAYSIPEGIKITVEDNTRIKVEGIDKQLVGEVTAQIKRFKPVEPYKGKGVRVVGEYVRRKEGKKAT